jgi:hypothetical protein
VNKSSNEVFESLSPQKGGLATLIYSLGARSHVERWVLPAQGVKSLREG